VSAPRRGGRSEPERLIVGLSWAAAELGVSISTARRLARAGELPGAFVLGDRVWRVSTVEFRRQVEAKATPPDRPVAAPLAPVAPLAAAGRASVPGRALGGTQSHRGRQIAAEAPRPSITGEEPSLVRRKRPRPQGESS
jgi:Helix-turn-helix domain